MGTPQGFFTDFYTCPLCQTKTRHYEVRRYDGSRPNKQTRQVFCEHCGIIRYQSLNSTGWTFGTKDNLSPQETHGHV